MSDSNVLSTLITLSHELGNPKNDYSIIAEGNTSTLIDKEKFWVKGSGQTMGTVDESGFVAMCFEPILALLDGPNLVEKDLKAAFNAAKADPSVTTRPSIEVALHALLLTLGGAQWVGHTHPTAWNGILCSVNAEKLSHGRLFPDQVVVCGPAPCFVKYTDPGLPLAREVRTQVAKYIDAYGMTPKEIFMQNHGFIALGQSPLEVERITAMSVKAARILAGTLVAGGPNFMDEADISHLWTRPDEIERRAKFV